MRTQTACRMRVKQHAESKAACGLSTHYENICIMRVYASMRNAVMLQRSTATAEEYALRIYELCVCVEPRHLEIAKRQASCRRCGWI